MCYITGIEDSTTSNVHSTTDTHYNMEVSGVMHLHTVLSSTTHLL